uniref:G_PROTEIN_RECEP_F1_2 domain-containing protein n=1 Tax=Heterorhabditis bacteriophora TaxID=37862 RepID=A0A1I7W9V7_HETBA
MSVETEMLKVEKLLLKCGIEILLAIFRMYFRHGLIRYCTINFKFLTESGKLSFRQRPVLRFLLCCTLVYSLAVSVVPFIYCLSYFFILTITNVSYNKLIEFPINAVYLQKNYVLIFLTLLAVYFFNKRAGQFLMRFAR